MRYSKPPQTGVFCVLTQILSSGPLCGLISVESDKNVKLLFRRLQPEKLSTLYQCVQSIPFRRTICYVTHKILHYNELKEINNNYPLFFTTPDDGSLFFNVTLNNYLDQQLVGINKRQSQEGKHEKKKKAHTVMQRKGNKNGKWRDQSLPPMHPYNYLITLTHQCMWDHSVESA